MDCPGIELGLVLELDGDEAARRIAIRELRCMDLRGPKAGVPSRRCVDGDLGHVISLRRADR
jgi:hypothetical protein